MHLLITNIAQDFTKNGDEYKKVTGTNVTTGQETTKSIFNNLEDKWSLLEVNKIVELKMEKRGQFWNTIDILPAETPPPNKPGSAPLDEKTQKEIKETNEPKVARYIEEQEQRIRSMCASYAKDLACAGKIELNEMKTYADNFLKYIYGE